MGFRLWLFLAMLTAIVCVGCGSTGNPTAISASTVAVAPSSGAVAPVNVTCTAVSGQVAIGLFFLGQAVQCAASPSDSTTPLTWQATAGTIDSTGLLTAVESPGPVTVTAANGSGQASGTIQFAAPIGGPALIFSTVTSVAGPIWGLAMDSQRNIYGAGWIVNSDSGTVTGELYSMDFWARIPRSYTLGSQSMFSTGLMVEQKPVFGGSAITPPTEQPLIVAIDSAPHPLISGGCSQPGTFTALAYDESLHILQGAWSTDTQSLSTVIDPASLQIDCAATRDVLAAVGQPITSPYALSLQSFTGGTAASGDFVSSAGTVTGFITTVDQTGSPLAQLLIPGLAGIRISAPAIENGEVFFYATGHQTDSQQDVWTVMKLDAALNEVWTRSWVGNSTGQNQPLAIILYPGGGVVVAGCSTQITGPQTDPDLTDAILMAYDSNGSQFWGPLRISPDNGGSSTYIASLSMSSDQKFMIAAGGGTNAASRSFFLGFVLP